jgi:predicted kinase
MAKLVLVQGFPFSGKTELAKWVESDLGYARLCADDARMKIFKKRAPEMAEHEEAFVWRLLSGKRDAALLDGKSVVWDSAAYNTDWRRAVLEYDKKLEDVERYLVDLKVRQDELLRRGMERESLPREKVEAWLRPYLEMWQEVGDYPDVKIIVYENNSREDLERIKQDLRQKLI